MPSDTVDGDKQAILARPLGWLVRKIVQHPGTTLVASLLVALGATFYGVSELRFKTDRGDLLSPDTAFNQQWMAFEREFHPADDLVFAVAGEDTDSVLSAIDDIAAAVKHQPDRFSNLLYKVEVDKLIRKGCYYLSLGELQAIRQYLDQLDPILAGNWDLLNLRNLLQGFRHQIDTQRNAAGSTAQSGWIHEAGVFADSLSAYLAAPSDYRSPWTQLRSQLGVESMAERMLEREHYLLADSGKMGFVQAQPRQVSHTFLGVTESVTAARDIVGQVREHHPEVQVGLTGLPVLENDEMRSSQRSMGQASLLSLSGVALLFILGFRGVRHPLLAVVALLVGLAWSVGFVTLSVGHLNILSVSFSVILIGLGIDFGIHFLARYLDERRAGQALATALERTGSRVGPGIVTAAVTTSLAFLSASLTEFLGIAELGIVAGGGIVLCMLASLIVLPALVVFSDRNRRTVGASLPRGFSPLYRLWLRYPSVWIAGFLAGSLALGSFSRYVHYDHNLLKLQAEGLESVGWENRIVSESNRSVWYAISVADSLEQARRRRAEFEALKSVSFVDDVSHLIPPGQDKKQELVAGIAQRLAGLPDRLPAMPPADPKPVRQELGRLIEAVAQVPGPEADAARKTLKQADHSLASLSPADQYAWLSGFQERIAKDLLSQLAQLRDRADPDPVSIDDLPPNLVERYVSPGGKWLLKVYAGRNVWEFAPLRQFVSEVRQIDPEVTGKPLLAYQASLQMKASYEEAALYALAAIVVVLLLDFRRIDDTILALLPVVVGMLLLFGTLGLFQIDLNPANMIVLPLILGIGIDNGVHVLHDFRTQRGIYWLSESTAGAIVLTSLTTMIGFGSLMISDHRGIRSLGIVLTIGVGCCLVTSVVLLPAVLSWISRPSPRDSDRRPEEEDSRLRRRLPPRGVGTGENGSNGSDELQHPALSRGDARK